MWCEHLSLILDAIRINLLPHPGSLDHPVDLSTEKILAEHHEVVDALQVFVLDSVELPTSGQYLLALQHSVCALSMPVILHSRPCKSQSYREVLFGSCCGLYRLRSQTAWLDIDIQKKRAKERLTSGTRVSNPIAQHKDLLLML